MTRVPNADLERVLRGVHACPAGLTCRPGGGVCYPSPTRGRVPGAVDVLLVAWNPRVASYARATLPDFATWRAEGAAELERAAAANDAWARAVAPLLPDGYRLDDARVASTFVWKWPTRVKTGAGASRFYADRCVEKHFRDELAALRPRLLLAHDTEAADFFAAEAESRGLAVRAPPPAVKNPEMRGWVDTSDAWGWPMGLVLIRDARDRYDAYTARFARAAAARVLGGPRA